MPVTLAPEDQYFTEAWLNKAVSSILILHSRRVAVTNVEEITERLLARSKNNHAARKHGQKSLFLSVTEATPEDDLLAGFECNCSLIDVLKVERELLGVYLTIHPTDLVLACGILGLSAYSKKPDISLVPVPERV